MNRHLKGIFPAISGFLVAGCSVTPKEEVARHIISTDSFALYYDPPNKFSDGDLVKSNDLLERRMGRLTKAFKGSKGVKEVMIFAHGGLTGERAGIEGAIDKFNRLTKDGRTDIFPIFITWDTDLLSSYRWHLFRDSNGITDITSTGKLDEIRGVTRAPFLLVSDLGSGLGNAPKTFYNATAKVLQNYDPLYRANPEIFFTRSRYEQTLAQLTEAREPHDPAYHPAGAAGVPFEFSLGKEVDNADSFASAAFSTAFLPVTTVLSPLYDGLGRPAWENMLRRSKTLVYRHPTLLDLDHKRPVKADGVIPRILREVRTWQQENSSLKVTFVGHSMGTIALNETFRAMEDDRDNTSDSCDVRVDKIVYLGSACSIRDFSDTVGRYMKRNTACETYAVSLHPKREVGEKFLPYLPLVYSGSLLTWIDQFFQAPRDFKDRTFGSFENCIIAYRHLPQTPMFHLKGFGAEESFFNKKDELSGPQKHGEMAAFSFWDPKYYQPVNPNRVQPTYQIAEVPGANGAAEVPDVR